jgi:hypothetical protein
MRSVTLHSSRTEEQHCAHAFYRFRVVFQTRVNHHRFLSFSSQKEMKNELFFAFLEVRLCTIERTYPSALSEPSHSRVPFRLDPDLRSDLTVGITSDGPNFVFSSGVGLSSPSTDQRLLLLLLLIRGGRPVMPKFWYLHFGLYKFVF